MQTMQMAPIPVRDFNATDVSLSRIFDNGSDDLVVINNAIGKTLTLFHQF